MERGEIWRASADDEWPVVLLDDGGDGPTCEAVQVVAAATAEQKRGYVLLTADEAARLTEQPTAMTGIEVPIPGGGVVRVALPHRTRIFCTWQVTVEREALIERVGTLDAAQLEELSTALRLAGME